MAQLVVVTGDITEIQGLAEPYIAQGLVPVSGICPIPNTTGFALTLVSPSSVSQPGQSGSQSADNTTLQTALIALAKTLPTEEPSGNYQPWLNGGVLTFTAGPTSPGAPSVTLTPGDGQVVVTVGAPASNGGDVITGYPIMVGASSGTEALATTLTAPGTYTIAGTNGTAVFVKVGATNSIGTTYAAEQSATPTAAT